MLNGLDAQLQYLKATISYEGLHRKETYPIPKTVLREAVLNAIERCINNLKLDNKIKREGSTKSGFWVII